jgi:protein-S-isoprenylcysteine O-methyltransferase Ste14
MLLRHVISILALPFVVTVVIPYLLLRRTETQTSAFLQAAGLLLMGVGIVLIAGTIAHFARRGRGTLAPWDPPRDLVVTGVYRHVRNPMISGVVILLAGQALCFGATQLGAWAGIVFVANSIYIPLVEEKGLARSFGYSYERYRQHVPRWVPRLSAWHDGGSDDPGPSGPHPGA